MANMTESQKKGIMVLMTILISVIIYTMGISPMNANIKKNTIVLEEKKKIADDMALLINDVALEGKYEKLKTTSTVTFNQNYKSFKANEKIEEILKVYGVEMSSLNISSYEVIDPKTYEYSVVQPKTSEEYDAMQGIISGPLMELFLVSQVTFTAELPSGTSILDLLNALNNIKPNGPGDQEVSRYCIQIPELTIEVDQNTSNVTLTSNVNMYGMQPPPLD